MFGYLNDNFSVVFSPDEMIDLLLELYNKIKEKFQFINKNHNVLLVDDSLSSVDLMMDSLNKLADMLEVNPLFEDEFFLSLSIINYVEYIIDYDILKDNIAFVGNIIINFCKLICDKQDWVLSNKSFNYEKEYEEFLSFFVNQKKQFLAKLPNDDAYNDAIDKVTNILW